MKGNARNCFSMGAALLAAALLLAACQTGGLGRDASVWRNYDYLTPLPSTAPVITDPGYRSRIRPSVPAPAVSPVTGRYDNDYDYTPPSTFGSCTDEDLANYTCK